MAGESLEGFRMTVLPHTIDAMVMPAMIAPGKFHGGITMPTPSGMYADVALTRQLDRRFGLREPDRFARVQFGKIDSLGGISIGFRPVLADFEDIHAENSCLRSRIVLATRSISSARSSRLLLQVLKAACAAFIAGSTSPLSAFWKMPTTSLGCAGFSDLILPVVFTRPAVDHQRVFAPEFLAHLLDCGFHRLRVLGLGKVSERLVDGTAPAG